MTAPEETDRLRLTIDDLVVLATVGLAGLLARVNMRGIRADLPMLRREIADLVDGYGLAAASVASDWYSHARYESPVVGRFIPRPVVRISPEDVNRAVGWGVKPLFGEVPDLALAESRLTGGVQRLVTNSSRETLAENARRDPSRPRTWRHAQQDCCAFCMMLATRPATRGRNDFRAHNYCRCSVGIVFDGEPIRQPAYYGDFHAAYDDAADAARASDGVVVAPSGRRRRDTVLWRIRQATGRA